MHSLPYQIPAMGKPRGRDSRLLRECEVRKVQRPVLDENKRLHRQISKALADKLTLRTRCKELKDEVRALTRRAVTAEQRVATLHLRAMSAEQSVQVLMMRHGDADLLTFEDREQMRALDKEGLSVNEIAQKFEVDLITASLVIEGLA